MKNRVLLSFLLLAFVHCRAGEKTGKPDDLVPKSVAVVKVLDDRLMMHAKPDIKLEVPIAKNFIRRRDGNNVLNIELKGRNYLPPELAAPGKKIAENPPPGGSAMRLDAGKTWTSPLIHIKHKYRLPKHSGLIFSGYVRAAGKEKNVPVKLGLDWIPATGKNGGAPEKKAEKSVTAGPEWKRVFITLEQDRKEIDGNVRVSVTGSSPVEFGALQLDLWHNYPQYLPSPVPWMAGGAERGKTRPGTFEAEKIPMNWSRGAISVRVRVPDVSGREVTGDRAVLFIGKRWQGIMQITMHWSKVGGARLYSRALRKILADGKEHLLVLSWNGKEAYFHADGKLLSRAKLKKPLPADAVKGKRYRVWIGTHDPRFWNIGGDIRDLRFFDQPLSAKQVKLLEKTPPQIAASDFFLPVPVREAFRRDEEKVRISLPVHGKAVKDATVRVEALPDARCKLIVRNGKTFCDIQFQPWLYSAGERKCAIVLSKGKKELARIPWNIWIVPAEAHDCYTIGDWGGRGTKKSLLWAKDLGLGLVDSRNVTAYYLNLVGRMGLRASANFRNISDLPHPAADIHISRLKYEADSLAEKLAPFPWVTTCIHNSEGTGRDDVETSSATMRALKKDLGLDAPMFKPRKGWADLARRPKVNLEKFAGTGIVPNDYLPLRYVKWLMRKGDGMNFTSAITTAAVRRKAPHVRLVQEPARIQYAAWADVMSNWRYANSPGPMLTVWKMGYAAAQAAGKEYYPLTGHCYYAPEIFLGNDRKTKVPPSGDMAAAFLWTGLAMPAKELRCFGWWSKDWEKNERLRPGSAARIKTAVREVSRLGPVVGDVPFRTAPLAVLYSGTNKLGRAGEEWWHAYNMMLKNINNNFIDNDLQIDFLYESQVLNGGLDKYRYLYIPGLKYQLDSVNKVVQDWRKKGGTLILDNQANPVFKADMLAPKVSKNPKGLGFVSDSGEFKRWVKKFKRKIKPYTRLENGRAIVMTKECPGTKFVFVINNKWAEAFPGKKLAAKDIGSDVLDEMQEFREKNGAKKFSSRLFDVGVKQTVTVSLLEKPNAAIYNLRTGKRLTPEKGPDGRVSLKLPLKPGSAAVLAVYPQPPEKLVFACPEQARCGKIRAIDVKLLGDNGKPLKGRQGVRIDVYDSRGRKTDASAVYRLTDGQTTIPLRLPLDAPAGTWRIEGKDLASSLKTSSKFTVVR